MPSGSGRGLPQNGVDAMYKVYWEGDFQAEFKTLREAKEYVQSDIKGMAETYHKTQKWVREHFTWTIEYEED